MEKNKVESRYTPSGDEVRKFFREYFHATSKRRYSGEEVVAFCRTYLLHLATRPSVPEQGQAPIRWKIEGDEKFLLKVDGTWLGPTEATACEMELWAALAASRSEVVTAQRCLYKAYRGTRCQNPAATETVLCKHHQSLLEQLAANRTEVTDAEIAKFFDYLEGIPRFAKAANEYIERLKGRIAELEAGAPAAGLMPSCTVCGEIMQGVCKCGSKTGAAGSTEWAKAIEECAKVAESLDAYSVYTIEDARNKIVRQIRALAGTDTDVAKESYDNR